MLLSLPSKLDSTQPHKGALQILANQGQILFNQMYVMNAHCPDINLRNRLGTGKGSAWF